MKTFISTMPYEEKFSSMCKTGWGCGYVHIPSDHPILVKLLIEESSGYTYLQPDNCEQEITLSQWDLNKEYYVIGFDTAHSYNNSTHDEAYIIAETEKIKALVDAYTKEDAHKEASYYMSKVFNMLEKYIIHE
jgi:hypothetical protein